MTNSELKEQLDRFCKYFIQNRKYSFEADELGFNYDQLIAENILTKQDKQIQIANNFVIASEVLPNFKQIFGFVDFTDAEETKRFHKSVVDYFDDGVLMGRTAFNDAMMEIAVKNFASGSPDEFIKFAKTFNRADDSIFDFLRGFRGVSVLHNFNALQIITLYTWLYDEAKAESPNVFDSNIGELAKDLNDFCNAYPAEAIKLYETCILGRPQLLKAFHVAILASIYDNDHTFLTDLKQLIGSDEDQQTLISCLTIVKFGADTPLSGFIELVESIKSYTPEALLVLPRFYTTVLVEIDASDQELRYHCFDKLLQIMLKYPNLIGQTVFEMRFLTDFKDDVFETIAAFIDNGTVPQGFGRMLSNMYPNFGSSGDYFKILKKLALLLTAEFKPQEYSHAITLFQHKNAAECDENLIKLLIDDEGFVRYAATRLLNTMSMLERKKAFVCNLFSLSAIDQYKLVVSITNDFHEPKYVVPFIAPLLDSPFILVRDLVLHQLEILSENYFSAVEEILSVTLDRTKPDHKEYIKHIETYTQEFTDNLNLKLQIKELDPRHNQSKYFNQYFTESQRKFSESLDKSVKENSLMSILGGGNDIMLAKGGGFYIGEQNTVQQLSSIKTQMSLPREYYLAPERYDWEHRNKILENWKNIFSPWEAMISS